MLFPLAEYWWFYLGFGGLVAVLLAIDLLAHRKDRPISMRSALVWTAIWTLLGLGFSLVIHSLAAHHYGPVVSRRVSFEYLTGYLVEESLSIDNMFVFALLFRYFSLSGPQQHRVLLYGIWGAMLLRGIFVAAGAALIQFHWVLVAFGVFLIVSGGRLAFGSEKKVDPERSQVFRISRRFLPMSPRMHGTRFVVRDAGRLLCTPLLLVLLLVETSDILFAVDSVPAVFSVTKEPLVVYTSNIFAVLGLRSLYFVLAGAIDLFHFLKYGLSIVLVFVGLKMLALDDLAGGRMPIGVSLGIIVITVLGSIILSLVFSRTPGRQDRTPVVRLWGRFLLGWLLGALCCLSVGFGLGLRPEFLKTVPFDLIKTEWLYVSGMCWGVCSWMLLRSRPR